MLISCQSSGEKVDLAKENVAEAEQALNQAISDSIVQFKQESELQISANEKSIAEIRTLIAKEKKETIAKYEKSLTELEQKNDLLKEQLNDFEDNETNDWDTFKTEFSSDMNDLGTALKNFSVKNS